MEKGVPKETIATLKTVIKDQRENFSSTQISEKIHPEGRVSGPQSIYDSDLEIMQYRFSELLPNRNFESYLRSRFPNKIGKLIGVELGGPGSKFFGGFSEGLFKKTAGVSVADLREEYQTSEEQKVDRTRQHSIIEADIFSVQGPKAVDEWLAGEKLDFATESMVGGWHSNERYLPLFAKSVARWYERLGGNGVMFLDAPFVFSPYHIDEELEAEYKLYRDWLKKLQAKYAGLIEITIGKGEKPIEFKLEKLSSAPDKIEVFKF